MVEWRDTDDTRVCLWPVKSVMRSDMVEAVADMGTSCEKRARCCEGPLRAASREQERGADHHGHVA